MCARAISTTPFESRAFHTAKSSKPGSRITSSESTALLPPHNSLTFSISTICTRRFQAHLLLITFYTHHLLTQLPSDSFLHFYHTSVTFFNISSLFLSKPLITLPYFDLPDPGSLGPCSGFFHLHLLNSFHSASSPRHKIDRYPCLRSLVVS